MSLNPEKSVDLIYPCPFCSGEILGHAYIKNRGEPNKVYICCDSCGASGPICISGDSYEEVVRADNEAVERWNNLANFKPTNMVSL